MSTAKGVVIVGNDTEIGKTTIACQLIELLRDRGLSVGAFKPAASGCDDDDPNSDFHQLIKATGRELQFDEVCPYRFTQAVAPVMAATKLEVTIDEVVIQSAFKALVSKSDFVVVETAGGLMSPLTNSITNLDFCRSLELPVIVVVENRLGAINQANLVCSVLKNSGQAIVAIVFNQTSVSENENELPTNNIDMFADMYQSQHGCAAPKIFSVGYRQRLGSEIINELSHSRWLGF